MNPEASFPVGDECVRRLVLPLSDQRTGMIQKNLLLEAECIDTTKMLRGDLLLCQTELSVDLISDRHVPFGVLGAKGLSHLLHQGKLIGGFGPGHDLERRGGLGGEVVPELADQDVARRPGAHRLQAIGRVELQAKPVLDQLEQFARRLLSMDPNRYEVSEPELLRGLTLS
jgi:hypothetical protein